MSADESSAGTPETTTEATNAAVQSLGQLLAEADSKPDNTPEGNEAQSSGSEEKTTPTKFNDLAGANGLELDDLYKLTISLSDDAEPVTVEQLKDSYAKVEELDLRELEFAEERAKGESELLRARNELQQVLAALPKGAVNDQVLERIRANDEKVMARERGLTLDAIPQWNDAEVRTADLAAMTEHLQQYGFPVGYLEQVVSHQQLKYIRDNMLRERRVRDAIAKVKAGKPDKTASSKATGKAPKKTTAPAKRKNTHANPLQSLLSTEE